MEFEKWLEELRRMNQWVWIRSILIVCFLGFAFVPPLFFRRSPSLFLIIVGVLLLNVVQFIDQRKAKHAFASIDAILYQDCDALKYLLVLTECYEAYVDGRLNRYGYLFHHIQIRYCTALLENGNIEEAINFLEHPSIRNRKSQTYRYMVYQTYSMKAYLFHDCSSYPMHVRFESYILHKHPLSRARKYVLFEEDEKSIRFLNEMQTTCLYEEVMKQHFLSICYRRRKDLERAKACEAFVDEHGQRLYLCQEKRVDESVEDNPFIEYSHTVSFTCDESYIKKSMRYEHRILTCMGFIACLAISWLAVIYLLLWNTKTFALAKLFIKGLPYSIFVMIAALLICVYVIYHHKKHKYEGNYRVRFHQEDVSVEDAFGVAEKVIDVQVRRGSYLLITECKKYILFTNELDGEDIDWLNRFVSKKRGMRLQFRLRVLFGWFGIFIFIGMAKLSYQTYIEPIVQDDMKYATIDEQTSSDGQYVVRLEVYAEEKNKSLFSVQLYHDGYNLFKDDVEIFKDFNDVTKDDWQVSFKEDAIYVNLSNQETIKVPYVKIEDVEDERTRKIKQGYQGIYQAYFKEVGYTYQVDFDAKANQYIRLFEDEKRIVMMSYDHDSANGKCGIYVVTESKKAKDGSWSIINATIQDFYAYEYDTGNCVRGDKRDYSIVGNDEYIALTGEG